MLDLAQLVLIILAGLRPYQILIISGLGLLLIQGLGSLGPWRGRILALPLILAGLAYLLGQALVRFFPGPTSFQAGILLTIVSAWLLILGAFINIISLIDSLVRRLMSK